MQRTPYAWLLNVGTVMFFAVVALLGVDFLVNVPFGLSVADSFIVALDVSSVVVLYIMGGVLAILVTMTRPWTGIVPLAAIVLSVTFLVAPHNETWDDIFIGWRNGDVYMLGILSPNGILAIAYLGITAWAAFKQPSTNNEVIKHRHLKATATTVAGAITYISLFNITQFFLGLSAPAPW
jgi:hypothetical protein